MKRALCLALLMSGCAAAPPAPEEHPHPQMQTAADDTALVATYSQQQEALRDELVHPSAGNNKPDCGHVCELAANICTLSERICAITAHHDGEEDMERACSEAADRCSMAHASTTAASCTCPASAP